MIVQWILVIVAFAGSAGGVTIDKIVFTNAKECEEAKARILLATDSFQIGTKAVCVKRTTDQPLKEGVE